MENKEWAIAAAYAFMAKRLKHKPLMESYHLLGHNISEMNRKSKELFGLTMSELYVRQRKGSMRSIRHFQVSSTVELTQRGVTWLARALANHSHFPFELDRVYGVVDGDNNAILLVRSKSPNVKGNKLVFCSLPPHVHGTHMLSMHMPDELKAEVAERNLVDVKKILECVCD